MKILKFYKKALFIPIIFVIIIQIIWGLFSYDPDYKSEWLSSEVFFLWAIMIVIINALIVSILSTPILLNKKPNIKNSFVLSIVTWLLPPLIWLGYLIGQAILLSIKKNSINDDILYLLLNSIPFVIGLIWSFVIFRHSITNERFQQ